jgi:gliding motility-associated-like protein
MKKIFYVLILLFSFGINTNILAQGDDCSSAIQLTNLGNYCSSSGTYTNAGSTAGTFAQAACWGSSNKNDVWFKFQSIGSDVLITIKGSGFSTGATMKLPDIALYTGDCATQINEQACAINSNSLNSISLYKGGMPLATTYFIRITTSSANTGKFDLCINNYTPVPNPNDPNDCDKATIVCNKDAVSVGTLNGSGSNTTEASIGCFAASNESNSTWLHFKCKTTGTLDFDIKGANMTDDIDWVLMEVTDFRNCATKNLISCNIASCDLNGSPSSTTVERKTGMRTGETAASLVNGTTVTKDSEPGSCNSPANGYNETVTITAGKTYALFLNNDSQSQGFSVVWGGTSTFVGPESVISVDKTTICVGESISVNGSGSKNYTTFKWDLSKDAYPSTQTVIGPFTQTFNKTGSYPIILTTYDNNGCLNVKNSLITVNGLNADFTAPSVCLGNPTVFTCTTSGISGATWTFGDGGSGSGNTANHTYATAGDYTASLNVVGNGCTNKFTQKVSVLGASLTITPTNPQTCPGVPLNLNGTASVTGSVSGSSLKSSTGSVTVPKANILDYNTYDYSGVSDTWDGSLGTSTPSEPSTDVGVSTINVSGLNSSNWKINSVTINIGTSSAKAKLLTVYLESPCGTRIKLIKRTTSLTGTGFTNTVFNATATLKVGASGATGGTAGPYTGTYAAEEGSLWASNLLSCSNPNGAWKLIVGEYEFAGSANASITDWKIDFQSDVPNKIKTLTWLPTTNLSSIAYTGVGTTNGTAAATTSTAEQITLSATDDAGCTTTSKVTITVSSPSAPTANGTSVCSGTTATLTATGNTGATFKWYSAATLGTLLASTASYTTAALSSNTSYWVTQTSGGCESARTKVDVTISSAVTPSFTQVGPICSGYILAALPTTSTNSVTGTWSPTIDNTQTKTYTFTPTGSSCAIATTMIITVNSLPSISGTLSICNGLTSQLSAVNLPNASSPWTSGNTGTATISSSGLVTSVAQGNTIITYTDVNGCSKTASFTVNAKPTISGTTTVCKNATITLIGSGTANASSPWVSGTTSVATVANGLITAITPGSTGITYTDNNGCTANVSVTVNDIFTPSITCGASSTSSISVDWGALSGATSYAISYDKGAGAVNGGSQSTLSYSVTGLPANGSATVTVTPSGTGCYDASSKSCSANGCPSPTIVTHPSSTTKCSGASAQFTALSNPTTGITYQWQVSVNNGSFTNVVDNATYSGSTTTSLSVSNVTGLSGNRYQLVVTETTTGICSVTTTPATLTVNTLPAATISGTTTVCTNVTAPTVTFNGSNGVAPYMFTYTINGGPSQTITTISGNSVSLSVPTSSALTNIYALTNVNDANLNCLQTVTGQSATITINPILTPSVALGAQTMSSVAFSWASISGATAYVLSYKINNGAAQSGGTITGTTYTASSLTQGDVVELTVTPTGPGCYSSGVQSGTALVCTPPTIVLQPVDRTICSAASTTFTAAYQGQSSVVWQINNAGNWVDLTNQGVYTGVSSATLTISSVTGLNGNQYRLKVMESNGNCPVYTNVVTLSVNPLPNASVSASKHVCLNDNSTYVTFTGSGSTAPYTFSYTLDGVNQPPITSTGSTATMKVSTGTLTTHTYSILTVSDASSTSCLSTVTAQSSVITMDPLSKVVLACGTPSLTSVPFTWNAMTGASEYALSYSINSGTSVNIPNSVLTNYTATGLAATGGDNVELTVLPVGIGCYDSEKINCTALTCTEPTILTHPQNSIKCSGTSATFSATYSGASTVVWQIFNAGTWTDLSNTGVYSGVTSGTLAISDVTGLNGKQYRLMAKEVFNTCPFPSNLAVLSVNSLPSVSLSGTTAICNGNSTDIKFDFTGTQPFNLNYTSGSTATNVTSISTSTKLITVNPSTTTSYSATGVTDANGCVGTFAGSAIVTVNSIPVATQINDVITCTNTSVLAIPIMSTPSGALFNWTNSNVSIGLAGSGSGDIPAFLAKNLGNLNTSSTVTYTPTYNGCVGGSKTFSIVVKPEYSTVLKVTDSTMNSITYSWTPVVGATSYELAEAVNPSSTFPVFTNITNPNPTATTYIRNGLTMGDKVMLRVKPASIGGCYAPSQLLGSTAICQAAVITTNPISVSLCDNNEPILTTPIHFQVNASGSAPGGIKWQESTDNGASWNDLVDDVNTFGSKTQTLTMNNVQGKNGNQYRASVLGTLNACETFSNAANIVLNPYPIADFSTDIITGCIPLKIKATNTSGYTSVVWEFGDGTSASTKSDFENHTYNKADTFLITMLVTDNGCIDTIQKQIISKPKPIASFYSNPPHTLSIYDPKIDLTNTSENAVTFKWTFGDGKPVSSNYNTSHLYDPEPGPYKITLYASSLNDFEDKTCVDTATRYIEIPEELIYYIPNSFTPNGDERNNTFQPVFFSGYDPQHYKLWIFNRWGELIFESNNPDVGWDGTYGNVMCPTGTFQWKLEFKQKQSETKHYKTGSVNLFR